MHTLLAAALMFSSVGSAAQPAAHSFAPAQPVSVRPFAAAQAAVPATRPDFLRLDRNRDGYVSRVEAIADPEIAKRFASFDLDNDARLSENEFALAKEDVARRALLDSAITARVKAALLAERGIPAVSILVDTYEGRVQLSGYAPAPDMISRAGRVTAGVYGVRTVHNGIAVR